MGRNKDKIRMIPEQDKRICGIICFCQFVVVISCVSIVYLSVAIYSPSIKAFKSGFELEPVMCQTIDLNLTNNCRWASCGEWCLTKTSGFCPQIHSTVRRNGTDIQLNNCTSVNITQCPQVDINKLTKYNCNNGSLCSVMHGLFNCCNGHCKDMTRAFQCYYKADGPSLDPEQDNTKLNGFFECTGPKCTKIKKPFSCDRICDKIKTASANVLIMHENSAYAANCSSAVAFNEAHGTERGVVIDPTEIWKDTEDILITNCGSVKRDGDKINATDCLNGTLLESENLPRPTLNFTEFWKIYKQNNRLFDPLQRYLPMQSNLTIYNSAQLFINLEGCVNTLRGECVDFTNIYGNDGDNNTAQSRYPCYYHKGQSNFVIARYDLEKTYKELLIALILPSTLFIVSSITLCILTKSIKVGDDTKMRCKYCSDDNSDLDESYGVNRKHKKKYHVDVEEEDPNHGESKRQETQETHEMVGSTKSLIPLSPTDELTDRSFLSDNNPTRNSEDPLVLI